MTAAREYSGALLPIIATYSLQQPWWLHWYRDLDLDSMLNWSLLIYTTPHGSIPHGNMSIHQAVDNSLKLPVISITMQKTRRSKTRARTISVVLSRAGNLENSYIELQQHLHHTKMIRKETTWWAGHERDLQLHPMISLESFHIEEPTALR